MLLYAAYAGSTLYNLKLANSDQDIRGIFIEPADIFFSLKPIDFYEDTASDTFLYSLRKFAQTALKSNPTTLEMLFAPTSKWITHSMSWLLLHKYRGDFISKKMITVYERFIEREYEYLLANKSNRIHLLDAYGYDTKNAALIARLLFNLAELKTEGIIQPELQGYKRSFALRLKRGDYTKIQAISILDTLMPVLTAKSIDLPTEPNYTRINDLVIHIYKTHYEKP